MFHAFSELLGNNNNILSDFMGNDTQYDPFDKHESTQDIDSYINDDKVTESNSYQIDDKKPERCLGCRYDYPAQKDHMDCDTGCLHDKKNCYKCCYD